MLCLCPPTFYMLWSVCCDASRLRHLTASFDSFAVHVSVLRHRSAAYQAQLTRTKGSISIPLFH